MMNVLIFGTGDIYRTFIDRIKERCHIIGLIDNNPNKQGKVLDGYQIYTPSQIKEFCYDKILICSTMYFDTIRMQLEEAGIRRDAIISFYDLNLGIDIPDSVVNPNCTLSLEEKLVESENFYNGFTTRWGVNSYDPYLWCGDRLISGSDAAQVVTRYILSGEPFCALRPGATESNICGQYIHKCFDQSYMYNSENIRWLLNTSGFFANDNESLDKQVDDFAQRQINGIKACDVFLAWSPRYIDFWANCIIPRYADIVRYDSMIPFDGDWIPWTHALKGKKVLAVTSFPESIERQYNRKSKLSKDVLHELPEFDLITYKTLETQYGNNCGFAFWSDAYDFMLSDILSVDFDVALIGAGAYGLPLAADIKKAGKQAIKLCGFLPCLFGVAGQRHIDDGWISKYGTDAWIRPVEKPPVYYKKIENGCYW